jgi:hypothetical protein
VMQKAKWVIGNVRYFDPDNIQWSGARRSSVYLAQ